MAGCTCPYQTFQFSVILMISIFSKSIIFIIKKVNLLKFFTKKDVQNLKTKPKCKIQKLQKLQVKFSKFEILEVPIQK